jgi:hypothetical protein
MHRRPLQLVSTPSRGRSINKLEGSPLSIQGPREGISPAALFTGYRPLRVVLTVAEVRHEVVKPDNGTAAKHSVVTGNLQL